MKFNLLKTITQSPIEGWTKLDLSSCGIDDIPSIIWELIYLEELNLCGNQIKVLSPSIGNLRNLKKLFLNGNKINELPKGMYTLTNLKNLQIIENRLINISPLIKELKNLQELYLSNNRLNSIPIDIAHLKKLRRLNLFGNELFNIPREIGELTELKELNLEDNNLDTIPVEIGKLKNLYELFLGNNELITIPIEIGNLENLQELDLSNNKLYKLPHTIGNLKNLKFLNLSNNKLTNLPKEIGSLKNLIELNLEKNRLNSLPQEIEKLRKLQILNVQDNPIPTPPEISSQIDYPQQIINYYLEHLKGNKHPLNEAKVLLVGEGGVGKTSLVNRLIFDSFNTSEDQTAGIEIKKWKVNISGDEIKLNIWDFGGQEIMHATHQFFFTKRSIYVLVLDSRRGENESRVEYWLKLIKSFGGDSPVIIVCNWSDQHKISLNWTGLISKFSNIQAIAKEVSCKTGKGIKEVRKLIRISIGKLDHIHDQLLNSWFEVKEELEDMRKNFEVDFIPRSDYYKLCQMKSINKNASQKTLLGFLHILGTILCYQDDPRLEFTYILNPEWVTKGVYQILNSHELFQNKGVLDIDELHKILNRLNNIDNYRYPKDKHLFIIDMMRKFELCFDFEGTKDKKFLIPDLLPKDEPYTGGWKNSLEFQYHYDVLPCSIISRFIVRMHKFIYKNTCWRTGVILEDERNMADVKYKKKIQKCIAIVKGDIEDKKVFINIKGNNTNFREFLSKIRGQFDAIHSTLTGINVKEKVPVPEHNDIPPIDYIYLCDLEEMGIEQFVPPGLKKEVSVSSLLNGIEPLTKRMTAKHQKIYNIKIQGGKNIMGDNTVYRDIKMGNVLAPVIMGDNNELTIMETHNEVLNRIIQLKKAIQGIEEEELSSNQKAISSGIIEIAIKEAEKKEANQNLIADTIKTSIDTIKNAGILVTATSSLGQLLVPITTLLGKASSFFF